MTVGGAVTTIAVMISGGSDEEMENGNARECKTAIEEVQWNVHNC